MGHIKQPKIEHGPKIIENSAVYSLCAILFNHQKCMVTMTKLTLRYFWSVSLQLFERLKLNWYPVAKLRQYLKYRRTNPIAKPAKLAKVLYRNKPKRHSLLMAGIHARCMDHRLRMTIRVDAKLDFEC